MHIPLPALELSLPVLLAAFSLCTSMLAILGTVQLVVSAPSASHPRPHPHPHHQQQRMDVGLSGMAAQRRWPGWSVSAAAADSGFTPLESRPPLSMAKLIMFRHAETQRRANIRAHSRLAQMHAVC